MAKERFDFDDTIEYEKDKLTQDTHLSSSSPKENFSFNDDKPNTNKTSKGNIKVKKNTKDSKKKKFPFKVWQVVLAVCIILVAGFGIYIFTSGNSSTPIYGKRCAKLLTIKEATMTKIEDNIKTDANVKDISIEKDCRTIKLKLKFVDGVSVADAENYSVTILHQLDDACGYTKATGATWSELFTKANGRYQYNADIQITTEGKTEGFPIFGTKQPKRDVPSFTASTPKSQSTTDSVKANNGK
ncbi:MAG: hypothetical protein PHH04_00860 [Thomasclavelia sp.]|jgi:hypothetical protein|nr:hypothetical protein [Thomasclavelia sp.]